MTTPDIRWLDDPRIFQVNRMPAHSDHKIYANEKEIGKNKSSLVYSLNGKWKFKYSENPMVRPTDFYLGGEAAQNFDTITVPGHIAFAGYDQLHYTNVLYPWDQKKYRRPPFTEVCGEDKEGSFSQGEDNHVGSYLKEFVLPASFLNKRVSVYFEGVEQACFVWCNGSFVGYAEDSFTPSEFDLTPYLKEGKNLLAVEVYKYSTAAFLEDQDFFRFFGIFRNVSLIARPMAHVEDIWAKPVVSEDCKKGSLSVDFKVSTMGCKAASVEVKLLNPAGKVCKEEKISFATKKKTDLLELHLPEAEVEKIELWTAKKPALYRLKFTMLDADDKEIECCICPIGFRRMEMKDKLICLNGKRLIINGVNRHEWNAKSGRCVTEEDMQWDIACFLRNNINAVRTCHYPDQLRWYQLCDEKGIYVMAETNLETHGSWMRSCGVTTQWNVPGSFPEWKEVVLDRCISQFETLKNHPSILFWSLGNESFAGDNIAAMNEYYKSKDPSRLVHYEGVVWKREYEDRISDVESRMYARPEHIREYLQNSPKKPFILCEYMHDMGNSCGGLGSYIKLLDEFPMYQGGFIWDFIDQAIQRKDPVTGEMVMCYGGDFDDRPSDREFSGNGIVFADRTEKPAMQEVRYYYGLHK